MLLLVIFSSPWVESLFTCKPMCLYVEGAPISEYKPVCFYACEYGNHLMYAYGPMYLYDDQVSWRDDPCVTCPGHPLTGGHHTAV